MKKKMSRRTACGRSLGLALSALAMLSGVAVQAQAQGQYSRAASSVNANAFGAVDAGARAAAELGLAEYVQHAREAGFRDNKVFDVSSMAELESAKVAGGFAVYSLPPNGSIGNRSDLRSAVVDSGARNFFVKSGYRDVGLITVDKVDGRWQAVSFGSSKLAQQLSNMVNAYGGQDAEALRYIRVEQARADMLEVVSASDKQARYALTRAGQVNLGAEMAKQSGQPAEKAVQGLREGYEVLQPLRMVIQQNRGFAR